MTESERTNVNRQLERMDEQLRRALDENQELRKHLLRAREELEAMKEESKDTNQPTKRATINHHHRLDIVAIDEDSGEMIDHKRTACNPAALDQLILSVESKGYKIDWEDSTVSKSDDDEDESKS